MKRNERFLRIIPYMVIFVITVIIGFAILFYKIGAYHSTYNQAFQRNIDEKIITMEENDLPLLDSLKKYNSMHVYGEKLICSDETGKSRLQAYHVLNNVGSIVQKINIKRMPFSFIGFDGSHIYKLDNFAVMKNTIDSVNPKECHIDGVLDGILLKNSDMLVLKCHGDKIHFMIYKLNKEKNFKFARVTSSVPEDVKYKNKNEMSLAYDGTFFQSNGYVIYSFLHIPYLFVFKDNGDFVTKVRTIDNVPFPKIVRYNDYYIYKRGETFNSNVASFIRKGKIFVFSYRIKNVTTQYVLDSYDLQDARYLGSCMIHNSLRNNNTDIIEMLEYNKGIVLRTKKDIQYFLIEDE